MASSNRHTLHGKMSADVKAARERNANDPASMYENSAGYRAWQKTTAAQEHAQRQREEAAKAAQAAAQPSSKTGEFFQGLKEGLGPNFGRRAFGAFWQNVKEHGYVNPHQKNKHDEKLDNVNTANEKKLNELSKDAKKTNTLVTDSLRKIDGKLEDILLSQNRMENNINKMLMLMNSRQNITNTTINNSIPTKEPQPRDPITGRFIPRNAARPGARTRMGTLGRGLGTGLAVAGAGFAAYDEFMDSGNAARAGTVGGGALAGMLAGGKLGAIGGAAGGPVGSFVGGLAGSAIGGFAGSSFGRGLYDTISNIGGERAPNIAGGLLSSGTTRTEQNLRNDEKTAETIRDRSQEIKVSTNNYTIDAKDSVTIQAGGKIEFKGTEIIFNGTKITSNGVTSSGTGTATSPNVVPGATSTPSSPQSPSMSPGGSGNYVSGSTPSAGSSATNSGPWVGGRLAGLGPNAVAPDFSVNTPSSGSQPQSGIQQRSSAVPSDGSSRIVMNNQGAIRNMDISPTLRRQLNYAAAQAGVQVSVVSGGQDRSTGRFTGSHRHDGGGAADVQLYRIGPNGQRQMLSMSNPQDAAIMEKFTREAVRAGATGVGAGYMGDRSIHIGGGRVAAWGGANWIGRALEDGRRSRINLDEWERTNRPSDSISQASPEAQQQSREAAYRGIFSTPRSGQLVSRDDQPRSAITPQTPQQFFGPQFNVNNLPAGMRNNNPGNLKFSPNVNWEGSMGPSQNTDQGTPQVMFNSPISGMRAMAKLATNKYNQGLRTVEQIIGDQTRGWTPGHQGAIANISRALGVRPNQDLQLDKPENLQRFMRALISQEHGPTGNLYTDDHIRQGIEHARGSTQQMQPHPITGAPRPVRPSSGNVPISNSSIVPNSSFPPMQGFGDQPRAPMIVPNPRGYSEPPRPVAGSSAVAGILNNDVESRRGRSFNNLVVPFMDRVPPDLRIAEAEREARRLGMIGDMEGNRGRAFNFVNSGAPLSAPTPQSRPSNYLEGYGREAQRGRGMILSGQGSTVLRDASTDDYVAKLNQENERRRLESQALMHHAERQAAIVNEVQQSGSLLNQAATEQSIAATRQRSTPVVERTETERGTAPSLGNDAATPPRATPSGQFAEEIAAKSSGPLVEAPERNQMGLHRMGSRYTQ